MVDWGLLILFVLCSFQNIDKIGVVKCPVLVIHVSIAICYHTISPFLVSFKL